MPERLDLSTLQPKRLLEMADLYGRGGLVKQAEALL
jgi:hypothetical protein